MACTLERRLSLPYRADQIFDLVADIERYPGFVPGWREARVTRRDPDRIVVNQLIAAGPLEWRFLTEARLDRPRAIDIRSRDAPFGTLDIHWKFEALGEAGCTAIFRARYELDSWLLRKIATGPLEDRLLRIVDAFEARARARYGSPG